MTDLKRTVLKKPYYFYLETVPFFPFTGQITPFRVFYGSQGGGTNEITVTILRGWRARAQRGGEHCRSSGALCQASRGVSPRLAAVAFGVIWARGGNEGHPKLRRHKGGRRLGVGMGRGGNFIVNARKVKVGLIGCPEARRPGGGAIPGHPRSGPRCDAIREGPRSRVATQPRCGGRKGARLRICEGARSAWLRLDQPDCAPNPRGDVRQQSRKQSLHTDHAK